MTGHFDGSKLNEMTIFQKMTLKIHCILSTNFHTPSYFGQSLKVNGLRTESRPSLNCPIELIKNQNLTIFQFKVHGLPSA